MRALTIATLCLGLLTSIALAQATSHLEQTRAELRRAAAVGASPLIEQARRAVDDAERAQREGEDAVAARALTIADAALDLLRERRAKAAAQARLEETRRRADAAEARVEAARRALEAIRAQRRARDAANRDADGTTDGGSSEADGEGAEEQDAGDADASP